MTRLGILTTAIFLSMASAASGDVFEYRESGWSRAAQAQVRGEVQEPRAVSRTARDDFGPRRYRHAWVALSPHVGLTDGREVIRVHDGGTFTQLRIQAAAGVSYVDRVEIELADGSRQIERVQTRLDRRNPRLEIPLDGNNRRVSRIAIVGDGRRDAAIQVFGI
jgi:hypothetical protein